MHCISCTLQLYFLAFRCVLYLCNWLCASRIGLGWAYDAIYLACHMFMHFPCIHTHFQYTCYIWNVLELFWLSIFSLLIVSMAPKSKSTSAWNPLRSEAFLSFDSTPISLWFHHDDAHKAFSENFSRRSIHSECQVILVDFADINLPYVIHS